MNYVYILRCADGSLYTGITSDLQKRFRQHAGEEKGGAKYTAAHPPMYFEAVWETESRGDALRLEGRIKRMERQKKLALIAGEIDPEGPYLRSRTEPDGTRISGEKETE